MIPHDRNLQFTGSADLPVRPLGDILSLPVKPFRSHQKDKSPFYATGRHIPSPGELQKRQGLFTKYNEARNQTSPVAFHDPITFSSAPWKSAEQF